VLTLFQTCARFESLRCFQTSRKPIFRLHPVDTTAAMDARISHEAQDAAAHVLNGGWPAFAQKHTCFTCCAGVAPWGRASAAVSRGSSRGAAMATAAAAGSSSDGTSDTGKLLNLCRLWATYAVDQ
jgi:hypothetical protein